MTTKPSWQSPGESEEPSFRAPIVIRTTEDFNAASPYIDWLAERAAQALVNWMDGLVKPDHENIDREMVIWLVKSVLAQTLLDESGPTTDQPVIRFDTAFEANVARFTERD